jgi:hypothetical protein
LTKRRKSRDDIRTGVYERFRDEPGGGPLIGQAVSGVKAARAWCAAATGNVGKRVPIQRSTTNRRWWAARGSALSGRNRETLSTVAARAGGPACNSDEALVMSVERRGRLICGLFARTTGRCLGGRE